MAWEMIDEVINTDFETFRSDRGNLILLYHCTSKEGAEGIARDGATREFTGKNANAYGQGFYTTFNLNSTIKFGYNSWHNYGKYIIQFGLVGGFKDFLIFDKDMNRKYNNGEPIEHQIKRLCPPDVVKKLAAGHFFSTIRQDYGDVDEVGKPLTAPMAAKFFNILKGRFLQSSELTPWQKQQQSALYDELDISKTKVRGYIFVGGHDGEVCVVRDFNSLVPLRMFDPTKGKNPKNPKDSGWTDILKKNTFDDISGQIDVGTYIRGRYPETPLNAKTICGYILVKGRPHGKYNYLNVKTNKELLPVPADRAVAFDPDTRRAKFIIMGDEYEFSADKNVFIEDGVFIYTPEEFKKEMKDKLSVNESLNKIKKLIEIL